MPCSFCYKRFDETKACLRVVPAERVARRALEVLAETPDGAAGRDSLAAGQHLQQT